MKGDETLDQVGTPPAPIALPQVVPFAQAVTVEAPFPRVFQVPSVIPVVAFQPQPVAGFQFVPAPNPVNAGALTLPQAVATPAQTPPPKCDICQKTFHTANNLRIHVQEIHKGGRGQFKCGDCGQVYSRLRSLERHQNNAHLQDQPQCRICRKKVVNFNLHYRKFHCKSKSVQVGPGQS